jgi:hypothetical protein
MKSSGWFNLVFKIILFVIVVLFMKHLSKPGNKLERNLIFQESAPTQQSSMDDSQK